MYQLYMTSDGKIFARNSDLRLWRVQKDRTAALDSYQHLPENKYQLMEFTSSEDWSKAYLYVVRNGKMPILKPDIDKVRRDKHIEVY